MTSSRDPDISFVRLSTIAPEEVSTHMAEPHLREHMPLLPADWDEDRTRDFVAMKEACWDHDGLGHWGILYKGRYVGWGGFQKEGDEWDFGLVLKGDSFGIGMRVAKAALDMARNDDRIPFVTFLLPPTRTRLGVFHRLGASFVGEICYEEQRFLKFKLETS